MTKAKPGYKLVFNHFKKNIEIPEDWKLEETSKIMDITMGQSPPSESYNETGEGLPFYQGIADFGYLNPNITVWCTDPKKTAKENSILFSVRAPVGETNLITTLCCLGRGVASLKPRKNNLLYCFYLLNQFKNNFLVFAQGSTYDAINKGDIGKTKIPFTINADEQQKIASVLSNIDNVILNYENSIGSTKKLKIGLMQTLLIDGISHSKFDTVQLIPRWNRIKIPVNWDISSISNIGNIVTGSTPSTSHSEYYGGDYLWASPEDIQDLKILFDTSNKLTKKGFDESRGIHEKSILFVCIGSTIGKVIIAGQKLSTNQQINSVVCKENDPDFIYYQLLFNSKKIKTLANNVAVPILNKNNFGKFKIPIPKNKDEQKKIGLILSQIDEKIDELKSKKSKIESLKKGLMQKLLTGQIRVAA